MARTYEISFKLGAQMAGNFAKTMASASGAMGQLSHEINNLGKQQSAISTLVKLRGTVKSTFEEFKAAEHRADQLRKVMEATGTKEASRDFEQASRTAARLREKFERQRQSLYEMNREMGTTSTRTAELVKRQETLAKSAEKAAAAQKGLQDAITARDANTQKRGELRGQLFDAAALAASLAAPIKAAVQFESAMADVNKVVDQTEAQSRAMGQAIVQMSREIPMTAEALAQIVAAGGQAGIAREDLAGFAESAAKMGVAFDVTADQAGEMMAKWRTAFSLSQTEVVGLADQINYLSNTSAASAPLISDVVTRIGGLGKLAGLNSGQVAAMGAALVAVGAPSEVAATGMQNLMLALTAGSSATKKQQQAFQALGLDAVEMASMMQNDAEGAIMSVLSAVKQLSAEERPAVLTEIFGKESIKSIGQLVNQSDILADNFRKVGDQSVYSGSMQKEFASRAATTENNIQLLGNRVAALGISLGNILLPGVNAVVGAIGPMVDMVANLANTYPTVTTVIVGGLAALIALKVAYIGSAYAFTFLKGAWLSGVVVLKTVRVAMLLATGATVAQTGATKAAIIVSKIFSAVQLAAAAKTKIVAAAQWMFNAALSANPIGLVIAGIAALIAAGIALYNNWGKVTAFFSNAWAGIKELFLTFHPLGWMMGGFDRLDNFLSQFSLYNSGKKMLSTLAQGIKAAALFPIKAVHGVFNKVREYLPFSDAKVGPFSQLTASGQAIMDTLGTGMSQAGSDPLTRPLSQSAGGMLSNAGSGLVGSGGGGSMSISITQEISVGGGSGADVYDQARSGAADGAEELIQKLQDALNRERRLSYA